MVASWVGLGSVFGVVGGELIDLMVLVNWSGIRIDTSRLFVSMRRSRYPRYELGLQGHSKIAYDLQLEK